MKPTQRDWSECSNPSNQSSKLQNQIFEILSANPLQTNQSKPIEKSKGKISFDPTQGNLFVISLKKIRGRGKKKEEKRKRLPTEAAKSTCTRTLCSHASIHQALRRGDNDNFIAFWCRPTCRRDNGPGRYATGQDRYVGATYSQTRVGFRLLLVATGYPPRSGQQFLTSRLHFRFPRL